MTESEFWSWFNQAREFLSKKQLTQALYAIDRALAADPSSAQAWNVKAFLLCLVLRVDEGIAAINRALELAPGDAGNWRFKASVLRNLDTGGIEEWPFGEEAKAAEMWATELEKHPESAALPSQAQAIVHAIALFISGPDWDAIHSILLQQQQLLFTDFAEHTLKLLEQYAEQNDDPDKQDRVSWLCVHGALLNDARRYGIERAWSAFEAYRRFIGHPLSVDLLMPPIPHRVEIWHVPLISSGANPDTGELEDIPLPPSVEEPIHHLRGLLLNLQRIGPTQAPEIVEVLEQTIRRAEQEMPRSPIVLAVLLQWLGAVLLDNPAGNEEDNIEEAIDCSEDAMNILLDEVTAEEHHGRRAFIAFNLEHNLASAYMRRLKGDMAQNREHAIAIYQKLLRRSSRNVFPEGWAKTQELLALAYLHRLEDPPAANMELALICHQEALTEFTFEKHPIDWGTIQLHLGNLYLRRICGDHSDNIEQAIACYESAMTALEYYPYDRLYLEIERNLGLAYTMRIQGNKAKNLDHARLCLGAPLWSYQNEYPAEVRNLHLDCAVLEASRDQWEAAHKAYTNACEMEADILRHAAGAAQQDRVLKEGRDAATRHGYVLTRLGRIEEAAVEIERGRARGMAEALGLRNVDFSRIQDPARRKRLEEAHRQLIEKQALLYTPLAEPGRELSEREERKRNRPRNTEFRLAKAQFDRTTEEIRDAGDPRDFLAEKLNAGQIQAIANTGGEGHALVYLVATPWGGIAVAAISTNSQQNSDVRFRALDLPELTDDFVRGLIEVKLNDMTDRVIGGFAHAQMRDGYRVLLQHKYWPGETFRLRAEALYSACIEQQQTSMLDTAAQRVLADTYLTTLVDIPSAWPTPEQHRELNDRLAVLFLQEELTRCLTELSRVMIPLVDWLCKQGVTSFTLIPCGALGAFPLGAAMISEVSTVAETLPMSVAPSARSLSHDESRVPMRSGIYILGNPYSLSAMLEPQRWSDEEAHMIAVLGGDASKVKTQRDAKLEWFIEATQKALVFHLGCHGQFDTRDFLRSKLFLANKEVTLGHLLSQRIDEQPIDLQGLRLLTLAACESAILDLGGAPDEVRSLAAGMTEAGARAVLASLWSADDRATYFLMTRFAYEWFSKMNTEPPAAALAKAQHWLRTSTRGELRQWKKYLLHCATPAAEGLTTAGAEQSASMNICPYANPFYWAGFQITGW
jgi:CHAT domain-containing protein